MPRATWKGAISFGLVNIPVSLHPAVSQKDVHFHMYHGEDGGRIHQKYVCEVDGEEVEYKEIVKGYEYAKGQVVTIDRDELKAMDPVADRTINIEAFVDPQAIDPLYFERPYYVEPDGRSDKAYGLLSAAMEATDRVAIGRVVLSTKQHLCMLRRAKGVLQLITLNYPDEIVEAPKAIKASGSGKEAEMARSLVEQLSADFEPGRFKDDYRERVLELIERKAQGEPAKKAPTARAAAVKSLAEALEKSLAAMKAGKKAPGNGSTDAPRATRSGSAARSGSRSSRSKKSA